MLDDPNIFAISYKLNVGRWGWGAWKGDEISLLALPDELIEFFCGLLHMDTPTSKEL